MSQNVRVVRVLSQGSFGLVVLVSVTIPGKMTALYAVKILVCAGADSWFSYEYDCLRALRGSTCPHTLPAVEAFTSKIMPSIFSTISADLLPQLLDPTTQQYMLIVMPYIKGVTLRSYLGALSTLNRQMSNEKVKGFFGQLALYCHHTYREHNITHNDLKLGNIIVQPLDTLKVIDQSFSTPGTGYIHNIETWTRGTASYMPPEKIFFPTQNALSLRSDTDNEDKYNGTGDVWALGTILLTMILTGSSLPKLESVHVRNKLLDRNGLFNPEYTDTVYELIQGKWFNDVIDAMTVTHIGKTMHRDLIEQGVKMCLWKFVLCEDTESFHSIIGSDLPGIEKSDLYTLIAEHGDMIVQSYYKHGTGPLEAAFDVLQQSDLYNTYCDTQTWDLRKRCGHSVDSTPFLWILRRLGIKSIMRSFQDDDAIKLDREKHASVIMLGHNDVGQFERTLEMITKDPCAVCGAKANRKCNGCFKRTCTPECFNMHLCD